MDLTKHFHFSFLFSPVASPSRHLRLVAARRERRTTPDAPNVGTVPPAHATDSPALQPLHSAPFQFRRLHFHSTAFRRPQTGETVRRQIVRARMMAGAASTGRETSSGQQAIAHESLLAGKASAIWPRDSVRPRQAIVREAPPGQDMAITVSTAIFRPLHSAGAPFRRSERWPTSLTVAPTQVGWSDTPPLGYMAVCRDFPFIAQPAISLHHRRVRIVGFALARLRLW